MKKVNTLFMIIFYKARSPHAAQVKDKHDPKRTGSVYLFQIKNSNYL
jgi:hypothetical protein